MGAFPCAGGYNFPFRAEKDTSFPRRTVLRSGPGAFGGIFPRRMLPRGNPGRFGGGIPRRTVLHSSPGGFGGGFLRRRVVNGGKWWQNGATEHLGAGKPENYAGRR